MTNQQITYGLYGVATGFALLIAAWSYFTLTKSPHAPFFPFELEQVRKDFLPWPQSPQPVSSYSTQEPIHPVSKVQAPWDRVYINNVAVEEAQKIPQN